MQLPFDLEDVIGVAAASVVKRMAALVSSLWVGWFLVGMAWIITEAIEWVWDGITGGGWSHWRFDASYIDWDMLVFAPFIPLFASWGVLYVPFLIGLIFYYAKSDGPSPLVWGGAVGVIGLFAFLCEEAWDSWQGWLALSVWLVLLAGMFFFLKWWSVILRVKAERHLLLIEQENDRKRQELKEEKGIATADREFAVPRELDHRAETES